MKFFKPYIPPKKVKSFISEIHNRKYENGSYFALGEDDCGNIHVSESNSLKTMVLAQNWICLPENIIYVN
jgi:hypothetical protein